MHDVAEWEEIDHCGQYIVFNLKHLKLQIDDYCVICAEVVILFQMDNELLAA